MANILVVDDEMGIRELLLEILSDEGHVVIAAENARAARQARAEAVPDLVLLEVGLGGRLDATNLVESDLAVVTSLALDHCDWLGNTREAIAHEKAGIYRPGKPAISASIWSRDSG